MVVISRRPLIAGNWKMNGFHRSVAELEKIIANSADVAAKADLLICPPATLVLTFAAAALGSKVAIGGQDCHTEPTGAFTGDISAEMLATLAPPRSSPGTRNGEPCTTRPMPRCVPRCSRLGGPSL